MLRNDALSATALIEFAEGDLFHAGVTMMIVAGAVSVAVFLVVDPFVRLVDGCQCWLRKVCWRAT